MQHLPRSGFTIVRNGIRMDYPFEESIRSLLPLVDELVIAVGDSADATPERISQLQLEFPQKIKAITSPWDPHATVRGEELARQTNIALGACTHDLCFYLQADEVLPDEDLQIIDDDLNRFARDENLDVLLFNWVHFYGSYSSIVHSKKWYRREIRALKQSRGLRSYGDAQSFRIFDPITQRWEKSRGALSRGHVLHYGWAKPEDLMKFKFKELAQYWGRNPSDEELKGSLYSQQFGMQAFRGQHPRVMLHRVNKPEATFDFRKPKKDLRYLRMWGTHLLEQAFDWRPGEFKSYRSLKKF